MSLPKEISMQMEFEVENRVSDSFGLQFSDELTAQFSEMRNDVTLKCTSTGSGQHDSLTIDIPVSCSDSDSGLGKAPEELKALKLGGSWFFGKLFSVSKFYRKKILSLTWTEKIYSESILKCLKI